ncbi:MAG TPA: squalene synthase HpnC [Herbaspirillum sp.]|jgi:squalene synthase HpnC
MNEPAFQPLAHYENFPVASILLPARLRPAVQVIYAFARSADDIADEGDALPAERLAGLQRYGTALTEIENRIPQQDPLFAALAEVMREYRLPAAPLRALLSAFRQDVATTRYRTFSDLLDYCARSADPVGAVMLHLYEQSDAKNLRESNAICSALQLINFWQDVAVDWRKSRIYIPLEDLQDFGIEESDIAAGALTPAWRRLMAFEVERTRAMLLAGAPLALRLPGRIGWELRLVVQGGMRILERIEQADYDVFRKRPKLGALDWLAILWRGWRM